MEYDITMPPKMRRVAENDYAVGVNFMCVHVVLMKKKSVKKSLHV